MGKFIHQETPDDRKYLDYVFIIFALIGSKDYGNLPSTYTRKRSQDSMWLRRRSTTWKL